MALRNHQGKANHLEALTSSCRCTAPPLLEAGRLVCGKCGAAIGVTGTATTRAPNLGLTPPVADYSQIKPPAGLKERAPKYFRVGRALIAAGDPGCWKEGRALLMTHAAWLRGLELIGQGRTRPPKAPPAHPAAVPSVDDAVLVALGLVKVAS